MSNVQLCASRRSGGNEYHARKFQVTFFNLPTGRTKTKRYPEFCAARDPETGKPITVSEEHESAYEHRSGNGRSNAAEIRRLAWRGMSVSVMLGARATLS